MIFILKEKHFRYSFFCLLFFFSELSLTYCQSNLKTIKIQFDTIVGEKNLAINNGVFNLRDYRYVVEGKTKYFLNKGYTDGSVTYDGQIYYAASLKYDLNLDLLVYNPKGASANIGCNLIKHKVDSFSILNKKFVNVDNLKNWPKSSAVGGYWQKVKLGKDFVFYIKYQKNKTETIIDDNVFYRYQPYYNFLLYYNNDFIEISSKNDVLSVFPQYSNEIENYYQAAQNTDSPLFYENLMVQIDNLLKI